MPDYVYALHDFLPENDDEVTFRQGERIEVVERDDEYSDGWWQVSLIHPYLAREAADAPCLVVGMRPAAKAYQSALPC